MIWKENQSPNHEKIVQVLKNSNFLPWININWKYHNLGSNPKPGDEVFYRMSPPLKLQLFSTKVLATNSKFAKRKLCKSIHVKEC